MVQSDDEITESERREDLADRTRISASTIGDAVPVASMSH
jgi:hypothetical protein